MNQSEAEANTCIRCKGRENVRTERTDDLILLLVTSESKRDISMVLIGLERVSSITNKQT